MNLFVMIMFAIVLLQVTVKTDAKVLGKVEITTATNDVVIKTWNKLDRKIRDMVESVVKQILPMMVRTSSEVDISDQCSATLTKFLFDLRNLKEWALQLVDASGKIGSGSIYGTPSVLGNYEECVNLTVLHEATKEKNFQGQYCTVDIRGLVPKRKKFVRIDEIVPPFENYTSDNYIIQELRRAVPYTYFLSYRFGLCVPSTCTINDMNNIVKYIVDDFGMKGDVSRCEIREELHLDGVQIAAIVIISTFTLICIIGTIVHVTSEWKKMADHQNLRKDSVAAQQSLLKKLLICFSLEENLQKLLTVEKTSNAITCLHGIRFLTMAWIILGHTYLFLNYQTLNGIVLFKSWVRNFPFQVIMNGLVSVDTFFVLSGLLMSYLTVRYVDKKGKRAFNVPIMIVRRLWRLLPSSCMIILFTLLIPVINSGPVWHEVTDFLSINCRKKWWADLIFVNNFVPMYDMCLPHTWYTAADSQLFLAALIFFFLLFRKPRYGMAFNVFLIVFSIVSTSAINYWKNFPPTMLTANPVPYDMIELIEFTHMMPNVHAGAYCIGLALGLYFARCGKTKLRPLVVALGWCFSTLVCSLILFSTYEWNRDTVPSVPMSTFYSGIHRTAWGLAIAWIVFACHNGYGGVVNRFLSWNCFVPLSRLTFMAYLWHLLVILVYIGSTKSGLDCYHIFMVWMYLANLCVSFGLAFFSYLLYEGPFALLERVVFGKVFARDSDGPKNELKVKVDDLDISWNGKTQLQETVPNGTYVIRL